MTMTSKMIPPPYPFPDKWPALFHHQQQNGTIALPWLTPYTPISIASAAAPHRVPSMYAPTEAPGPADPSFASAPTYCPNDPVQHHHTPQDHIDTDEDSEDGEYEYAYVLNDEWMAHLKQTVLSEDEQSSESSSVSSAPSVSTRHPNQRHQANSRQHSHNQKRQHPKSNKQNRSAPGPAARGPSQLELVLDDARSLERQRRADRRIIIESGEAGKFHSGDADLGAKHQLGTSLLDVEHLETALHLSFEAFCDNHTPAVWPQGAS